MLVHAKISGRIRGEDNKAVRDYSVAGYLEIRGLRVKVGSARTDEDGAFEIRFSPHDYTQEDELMVSVQIEDTEGRVVIDTPNKNSTTGRIDFQMKVGRGPTVKDEPDIYSGGMSRLVSAYSNLHDNIDQSRGEVKESLGSLIGVVKRWNEYRNELARTCGLEVIQVPKQPRKEEHDHVSRWDEAVLPS